MTYDTKSAKSLQRQDEHNIDIVKKTDNVAIGGLVITDRIHCLFFDYIYIMLILPLWDKGTLCVMSHFQPALYIICTDINLYIYALNLFIEHFGEH